MAAHEAEQSPTAEDSQPPVVIVETQETAEPYIDPNESQSLHNSDATTAPLEQQTEVSQNEPRDAPSEAPGAAMSVRDPSPAPESSQVQSEHAASQESLRYSPAPSEDTAAAPPSFAFSRMDRRALDLGSKLRVPRQLSPDDGEGSAKVSSSPQRKSTSLTHSSPARKEVPSDPARHYSSNANVSPYASDAPSASADMYSQRDDQPQTRRGDSVQYQIDEQLHHEASMSDGPEPQSEDVVCLGSDGGHFNAGRHLGVPHGMEHEQVAEPVPSSPQPALYQHPHQANFQRQPMFQSLSMNRQQVSRMPVPFAARQRAALRNSSAVTKQGQPIAGPQNVRRNKPVTPVPSSNDTSDLLEVVKYKFDQQKQSFDLAFSAEREKMRDELQEAYDQNDALVSQAAKLEKQCSQNEKTITKYRSQIAKAKSLQKFLDGLGNDLYGLKHAFDDERGKFTARNKASEAEIARLEFVLAGKNEYEDMLAHSKGSLEKLLDARNFELQSVIQHRDILRAQLDEKIGQLVEERDNRARLEQLVGELRASERSSLTASIEQCTNSLASKLRDAGRTDDQFLLGIAEIHEATKHLAQRSLATPEDCDAIKAKMNNLELTIAQSISVEAAASTTLVDFSTSVEGIVQHNMLSLWKALENLESSSKQSASDMQAQQILRNELEKAADRLVRLECQLDSVKKNEANLNDALMQSAARISELEAIPVPEPVRIKEGISLEEAESKVREAVSEAQKRFSDNANTFIAQEKARFGNEVRRVENERRRADEKVQKQFEELNETRTEVEKLRALKSTGSSDALRKLDEMTGRCQKLESEHGDLQREADEKRSLESRLASLLAECETAKSKVAEYSESVSTLTKENEDCEAALLQARAAEDHARADIEDIRKKDGASIDDLRRKLSKAEEMSRYAEAGLVQMKSSAEKTISQEQEKHRKQREALQQRLCESQSELQVKTKEAEDMRESTEKALKQQQAFWNRSHADLEAKTSDHKAALDEATNTIRNIRRERDAIQTQFTSLHAITQEQQQKESGHKSRETALENTISELRRQSDAAQGKVTELQSSEQQRMKDEPERKAREIALENAVSSLLKQRDAAQAEVATLRTNEQQRDEDEPGRKAREIALEHAASTLLKECDAAQTEVVKLQASERQRSESEAESKAGEKVMERSLDDLHKQRDAAHAKVEELQVMELQRQQSETEQARRVKDLSNTIVDLRKQLSVALLELTDSKANAQRAEGEALKRAHSATHEAPRLGEPFAARAAMPMKASDGLPPTKQRRKADRNTNTIVQVAPRQERPDRQLTRPDVPHTQAQVVVPSGRAAEEARSHKIVSPPVSRRSQRPSGRPPTKLVPTSSDNNDMLDLLSDRNSPEVPETQFSESHVSNFRDTSFAHNQDSQQRSLHSPKPAAPLLDFSGNLRTATQHASTNMAPKFVPSQGSQGSEFKMYEDTQNALSDEQFEESIRASYTFHKPFAKPNSASKRLSRTLSDKSLEGRISSRGARRTPENANDPFTSQPKKTPNASQYAFGSSPEFMNPASAKVKRRYSGSNTPGNAESSGPRASATPLLDPRIKARANAPKRMHEADRSQNEPPAKRHEPSAAARANSKRGSDNSFLTRASQSVNDLPRIEDTNAGRNAGKAQSSHMRTSGATTRTTRSQNKSAKDAYSARFQQELR